MKIWIKRILLSLGVLALIGIFYAAFAPLPFDPVLPKDKWGVVVANHKDLYGNVQDYTNQLRALETAIRDKPENPALRFLAGYHYAYLGFPKEAVDQLNRVLKIEPRDEMAKALRDAMQPKLPQPAAPPGPQLQAPPPAAPNLEGPSAMISPRRATARLAA